MPVRSQEETRAYDVFKLIVALILLAIIIILLLSGRGMATKTSQSSTTFDAAVYLKQSGGIGVSGIGTPGEAIVIDANGKQIGETVVGPDGKWSFESGKLAPGDYELTVKNLDHPEQLIASRKLTIPKQENEYALPIIDLPQLDADGALTLSGSGEPGKVIALYADNQKLGETVVGPDGKWSFAAGKLPPGNYHFIAKTLDADKKGINESKTIPVFTIPAPKQVIATPSVSSPQVTNEDKVILTGAGEPGATMAIFANGKKLGETVAGPDGKWTFDAGNLPAGDYLFTIQTLDDAGAKVNEATASENFTMPEALLAIPTIQQPALGEDGSLVLNGTGEPGAKIAIFANGKKIGESVVGPDGKWTFDAGELPAGDYSFSVATLNDSGDRINASEESEKMNVPEAGVALAPPIMEKPVLDDNGSLLLTGAGEPGATIAIFANGKKLGETVVGEDGKWTFDAGKLAPGAYSFELQTLDTGGNTLNKSAESQHFDMPEPTPPTPTCTPYIVKEQDWLTKLAKEYLGSIDAYTRIVDATNAMAAVDNSFTTITNPDRIEPGQKLCIPQP